MARTILLALLMVGGSGCTTYMNIRTLRPAAYNLHPTQDLVLVQGAGRDKALSNAGAELLAQVAQRGHFTAEDARSQNLRMRFSRERGAELIPQPDGSRDAVYLQLTIVEWSQAPAVVPRDVEVTLDDGSVVTRSQMVPVVRGTARLQVTLLDGDGKTTILRQEVVGGSELDAKIPPPPAAETATRNAVASVLALITPTFETSSVKLDRKDKETLPFIELARAQNIQGAADGLQKYVADHPSSSAGHYNLAVMLDALGDYEAALEHYDQAITLRGRRWYREGRISCQRRLAERERLNENQN